MLWVAADPGQNGYERFPYLMQALSDLGFEPAFRSSHLWAFFDYSYRTRADPDYLAARWRKAGIGALHVASWHFYDSDPERDAYLKALIEACHRHGVLVYAWVELPHVSEKFWNDHPAVAREDRRPPGRATRLAEADELAESRLCRSDPRRPASRWSSASTGMASIWRNSISNRSKAHANPSRFTPMNDDVRAEFRTQAGWDPIELWSKRTDAASLRKFLDFRAGLAQRMQEDWLATVESFRQFRPGLDVVLTHVDDRFDAGMKDAIGADAGRVLPLLGQHSFSFLIEDPATVWNLGPQRYPEIAKRYRPLTPHADKLAIDINIVDRYQDVYPTKQQTGTELFELVHLASTAFPRVALYFENSILKPDLALLAASSAVVTEYARDRKRTTFASPQDVEFNWPATEGAVVDGKPWPAQSATALHLPAGSHVVEATAKRDGMSLIDLNANLRSAAESGKRITFEYSSDSRAIARFNRKPARIEVDGAPLTIACDDSADCAILLPRGTHQVIASAQ